MKQIEIDLLSIFKSGIFYNLKVGTTRDWMLKNFIEPDNVEDGETWIDSNFWRYGNIDFFLEDNKLIEICARSINPLIGGKTFRIDPWILKDSKELTVKNVVEELLSEKIDFTVTHTQKKTMCQTSIGLIQSSVYLIFHPEIQIESESYLDWIEKEMPLINQNEYILEGFSIFENLDHFYEIIKNKNGL